jgi:metal-dependent amidase/aminoacylase/carboxypeptidase family protein
MLIEHGYVLHGLGGQAARPHHTVDAVTVAVQVSQALQYLVHRENDRDKDALPVGTAVLARVAMDYVPRGG